MFFHRMTIKLKLLTLKILNSVNHKVISFIYFRLALASGIIGYILAIR